MENIKIEISSDDYQDIKDEPEFVTTTFKQEEEFTEKQEEDENGEEFIDESEQVIRTRTRVVMHQAESYIPVQRVDDAEKHWVDAAVQLMLSYVAEYLPRIGKTLALKTKAKMWKKIEAEMRSQGYSFTMTQIENKFRHLERTYKNFRDNKTGKGRSTCPYKVELENIIGDKQRVYPVCILGAATRAVSHPKPSSSLESSDGGSATSASFETSTPKMKTSQCPKCVPSRRDLVVQELRLLRKERQAQLKAAEKKADQRHRERMEIARGRNSLLTYLIKELQKDRLR